jgi:hypothetical protein
LSPVLEGEGMSEVCPGLRHFAQDRYKIFNRYKEEGLDTLCDRLPAKSIVHAVLDRHGLVKRALADPR